MQLTITGRHVDISEAFHTRVEKSLIDFNAIHRIEPVDATIILSKENYQFACHLTMHVGKNVTLRCHGHGNEAYICFNNTLSLLTARLRRHKKRILDYHKHHDSHERSEEIIPYYVLNGQETEGQESDQQAPAIIAEQKKEIPSLTVGDAVMRLDLENENAMVFRNKNHGHINFIYRRSDGNIGWIDPQAK